MYELNSLEEKQLYMGWLLAGKLAEWLGMEVGMIQLVPEGPYLLVIDLPSGQISVEIPAKFTEGKWKNWETKPEDMSSEDVEKAIFDCLYGILTQRHVLLIPQDKKETTE